MIEGAHNLDDDVLERAVARGWLVIACVLAALALAGGAMVTRMVLP